MLRVYPRELRDTQVPRSGEATMSVDRLTFPALMEGVWIAGGFTNIRALPRVVEVFPDREHFDFSVEGGVAHAYASDITRLVAALQRASISTVYWQVIATHSASNASPGPMRQ